MRKLKIAAISLGQAPSTSVLNEIFCDLEDFYQVNEIGLLDQKSLSEIQSLGPQNENDSLICGLRDKYLVVVSKLLIEKALAEEITRIKSDYDYVIVLCSDRFDCFQEDKKIVFPALLILEKVNKLGISQAGVLVPLSSQIKATRTYWRKYLSEVSCFNVAINKPNLSQIEGTAIIADCMGYSYSHIEEIRKKIKGPVVSCREVVRDFFKNIQSHEL